MTALWIILAYCLGAGAMWLYLRERIRDAEFLRDDAVDVAVYWYGEAQRALPTDQWHEMGGDRVLRAIGLVPVDPASDAMWDELDGQQR
jgi:hypothetical protein